MSEQRQDAVRVIAAEPSAIFAVLCDPRGHVDIDSSGMLQAATGQPVTQAGDEFVVHMDREALGDRPLGRYDVTVTIRDLEPDRHISWTVLGTLRPPIGHVYGYRLDPVADGTRVTSYCDWSEIDEHYRGRLEFPVIAPGALRATLGILERVVARRRG